MDRLGRAKSTISAQTSQEIIECTKIKEYQRAYCPNIYTVVEGYPGGSENLLEYRYLT